MMNQIRDGFARQSFTREFVEAISGQMQGAIGAKWSEWGSEQVMSNIVIATPSNSSRGFTPVSCNCPMILFSIEIPSSA